MGGEGLKLLWLTKTLAYCGFGASKGLCVWDPLPRSCKRQLSCESSLSEEVEKRPEGILFVFHFVVVALGLSL